MRQSDEARSSGIEDRRIALSAISDAELPQGVWVRLVIHLVMEHSDPRAMALALILLKKYASTKWSSVIQDSKEYYQLCAIMEYLFKSDEPVLAMMAMVILNRIPRFNFQILLLTSGQPIFPWNVYLENLDGFIAYSVVSPDGETVRQHATTIVSPEPFTLENLRIYKDDLFREMSLHQHLRRHDRAWSADLFQHILHSKHPLAMALVVAKCVELNVWNDGRASDILTQIATIMPRWIAIPGFIASFISLSLTEFDTLNRHGFQVPTFAELLMASPFLERERCIEHSSMFELTLYLGLSLRQTELQLLYPVASASFFDSIGLVPEQFLDAPVHASAASAESRGMSC